MTYENIFSNKSFFTFLLVFGLALFRALMLISAYGSNLTLFLASFTESFFVIAISILGYKILLESK